MGQGSRARCRADRSARLVGHQPRPGRVHRHTDSFTKRFRQRDRPGNRAASARLHGPRSRPTHARRQRRHCVHRFVHQQPDRGPPGRRRGDGRAAGHRAARDDRARVSHRVKDQAIKEGSTRSSLLPAPTGASPGCSMCLAMNPDKLPPASARLDQQPQLRGPPGPRRSDPPRLAGRRCGNGCQGHVLYACRPGGEPVMKAVQIITGTGVPLKRPTSTPTRSFPPSG